MTPRFDGTRSPVPTDTSTGSTEPPLWGRITGLIRRRRVLLIVVGAVLYTAAAIAHSTWGMGAVLTCFTTAVGAPIISVRVNLAVRMPGFVRIHMRFDSK